MTAGNISRKKYDMDWKPIKPTEIKNAVELFHDDWMALAVGKDGDMNAMTISWGDLGELWERPIVTVYVSTERYTHSFMERNQYFTVMSFPAAMRQTLLYLGTHSGRDSDKIEATGLTTEFTDLGNPVFQEADLAIECKIIYKAPFDVNKMDPAIRGIYNHMGVHTMYIGQIINVWKKD